MQLWAILNMGKHHFAAFGLLLHLGYSVPYEEIDLIIHDPCSEMRNLVLIRTD